MAFGVGAVVATESWDARHEAEKALEDLTREHALLALALAAKLELPEARGVADHGASAITALCSAAPELERTGGVVVVLSLDGGGLRTCAGRSIQVSALERAARSGQTSLVLARDEAVRVGLPARVAVAGLAPLPRASGPAKARDRKSGTKKFR